MQKLAKKLSFVMAGIMTLSLMLNFVLVTPAKAATVVPKVGYVSAPKLEYTAGDRVQFNLSAPNYGGRVQYRVVLWDNNKKEMRDLWTTGDRYYTNWQPYGNETFTLGWPISEPGTYRITIYAKRAGLANNKTALAGYNCDSYMESEAFVVKPAAVTPVSVAPVADVTVDQFSTAVLPATVNVTMSDNTVKASKVTWPTVDTTKVGAVTLEGTVEGTDKKASVKVTVNAVTLAIKSVTPVTHNTAKLVFNAPVEAVDSFNFDIDGGNSVIKAELLADKVTVNLTFASSLVDGASYEVVANEVEIAGTTAEVSGLKATMKYDLAGIATITLTKNTFAIGENVIDFVSIKDKNGYEVAKSDYTVDKIESSNVAVVDNTDGSVDAVGTANVRFTVNYHDEEIILSPFIRIDVDTTSNGLIAGYEIAAANTADNAVEASNDVPEMYVSDAAEYLHVYIKDSLGNPETAPIDLSTAGTYTVTSKTPLVIGAGQDATGAYVEPVAAGTGTIEIKDTTTGWRQTVKVTVLADPKYKDLDVSAAGTVVKLSDAESTNPGVNFDEGVNQKTVYLGWLDQAGNDGDINAAVAEGANNATSPKEQVLENFAVAGDKLVVSTTSTAFTLDVATDGTLLVQAVQGQNITNAVVKVSYYAAAGNATATTVKSFNVTVVNVNETAAPYDYVVTANNTNLLSKDIASTSLVETTATFTAYAVDRSGNKLNKFDAAEIKLAPAANVPASVAQWFDYTTTSNKVVYGAAGYNPALYMPKGGTIEFEYTLDTDHNPATTEDPQGSIKLTYGDTKGIPYKAAVNTAPVLIDFNRLGAAVTSIDLDDILFGTVNANELVLDDVSDGDATTDTTADDAIAVRAGADGYFYAPVLTFTDIANAAVKTGVNTYGFDSTSVNGNIFGNPLTAANDTFVVTYAITNVKNVTDTAGTFTITSGDQGSFTLIIKSVKMAHDPRSASEQLELLSAPVAINVVLTDK